MKRIISVLLIVLAMVQTITVTGAGGLNLSGYVKNVLDAPLSNSRIDFNSLSDFADSNGYYEFTDVSEGDYTVLVRNVGYIDNTTAVTISSNTVLNFTLIASTVTSTVTDDDLSVVGLAIGILALALVLKRRKKKSVG